MRIEGLVLFPTQLFKNLHFKKDIHLFLLEHPHYFTDFPFHKQKLIFHRASMKAYEDYISQFYSVTYIEYYQSKDLLSEIKKRKITHLHLFELPDHQLEKEIEKRIKDLNVSRTWHESPSYLTSTKEINTYFKDKKQLRMASFYQFQRKRLGILVNNNKPVGGKWSFDTENRKEIPAAFPVPPIWIPEKNEYIQEASRYIKKNFANNPGLTDEWIYPITHNDAESWLQNFLDKRLIHFGDYEDAIDKNSTALFHSVLSPLLNAGLLEPKIVIEHALKKYKEKSISLNNIEGFVRQIIGWREYMRVIYIKKGKIQKKSNFWKHTKAMPEAFWKATTTIDPVDETIKKVLRIGYAHHIERLMILGNFMLLCEIKPEDVYFWFMSLFIDAYDWVMVPNVFGMSQYADGGLITTKPYISSSSYLMRMSNYKSSEWQLIWNSLYWNFIDKHKKTFDKNPRLGLTFFQFKKLTKKQLNTYKKLSASFLNKLL